MFPHGTHLRVFFGAAWHHGIYIGEGRVIHLSAPEGTKSAVRKSKSVVHEVSLKYFVSEYHCEPVSGLRFLDSFRPYITGDDYQAVERAKNGLGRGDYNLLYNNCEHFAVFCKTGERASQQVLDTITDVAFSISDGNIFDRVGNTLATVGSKIAKASVKDKDTAKRIDDVESTIRYVRSLSMRRW